MKLFRHPSASCLWLPALALAATLLALPQAAQAEKGTNAGVYRDRDGGQHNWQIQRGHTLVWNDKPYLPCGVVFRSEYLAKPSAETLQQDVETLDRLKSAGVRDLWIDPQRGLLENTAEQTQAVVDAVESRGFQYGLRVGDRTQDPLVGFSPRPAATWVPIEKLQPGVKLTWDIPSPRGRRVLYLLVDASKNGRVQNYAIASGEALVQNGVARIEIQVPKSRLVGNTHGWLRVAPEIQVEPDDLGSFGDLWTGMQTYAARVKKHLQAVKFGPGLRFVMDPFSAGDGTIGQEDLVFPASPAFRQAFKEWLQKRYGINAINTSWRMADRRIPGMEEAARLVPLWSRNDPPEGDGWLFDPVDRVAYRCTPQASAIWNDLETFRSDSLKRWMNTLAATLKQEGLNVPTLFSWRAYHSLFNNSPSPVGYDGLAAQLSGAAPAIGRDAAAYALAQAEGSDRNTWLVAARLSGPLAPTGAPLPIADATQLRSAWGAIREAGFRGVYLDERDTPNAVSLVKELAPALQSAGAAPEPKLQFCFFPSFLAGSDRVTRLANGTWWLPSAARGRLLRFGEDIMGYEIDRPFGDDHPVQQGTVLWSNRGAREATFYVEKFTPVQLFNSAGEPLKLRQKKDLLQITLTEEPVIAAGLSPELLFPLELAAARLDEFDTLLKQAEQEKLDTATLRTVLESARKSLAPHSAAAVYNEIMPQLIELRQAVLAYHWVEGERSVGHNFTGTAFQPGASGGSYLKLDRSQPASSGAYMARYIVDIRRETSYEIWMAGRVPGRPGVSPLIWQVDEEPPVLVTTANPEGVDYAPGMGWFLLGRMTLKVGRHELTIAAPEKAAGPSGRYAAAIDAIVFSRQPFKPNGVVRPFGKASAAPEMDKKR